MNKLMRQGWRFQFYANELGTYTAIATKDNQEIITDEFGWWPLIEAIVTKVESEGE